MPFEYEVHEIVDPRRRTKNIISYPHGGQSKDEADGLAKLRRMQDTYGPYGRVFRLMRREVSEWEDFAR